MAKKDCTACVQWDDSTLFDEPCSRRSGRSTVICFMFRPRPEKKKEDKK
jgi:hypothetical protein